jgi:spore maturation protein CgeB
MQKDLPLELYGGGWDGVLPEGRVRGTSVSNAELPDFYGGHLMLLNDHWDSMRDNGFLSNRLFDGSAVATPILTDPVAGLADVFGDAISEAADIESFADIVQDCMENPEPYLERARNAHDIVMAAHTFDHRAIELVEIIDRIAARKRLAA